MKAFFAPSPRRRPFLFLFLLLCLLTICAAIIHPWPFSAGTFAESTPLPIATYPQRTYSSKFAETPVPTLLAPYLSSPAPQAMPTATPAPSPRTTGLLAGKYAWRFSEAEVLTDHAYSNETVSISWNGYRDEINYSRPVTFYVADVLVEDVTSLKTAFARGSYSAGGVRPMETVAKNNHCIIAISGDFARWHDNGLIVRNGEVLRQKRFTSDLCVLYKSGVMETYEPGAITLEEILAMDPWQSWHFGPELLDHEGNPKKKFNTTVWGRNPRSAIGYYEPGHYCLVIVDGRQGKYSGGMSMDELSELMYTLGCVRAYNLDGGATAHMSWTDQVINSPSKDRQVNDVICVCFPEEA